MLLALIRRCFQFIWPKKEPEPEYEPICAELCEPSAPSAPCAPEEPSAPSAPTITLIDLDIEKDKTITTIPFREGFNYMHVGIHDCPKITKIPDMCNFTHLEVLKISHCSIRTCNTYFPDSLRTIHITYSMMESFEPAHMPIHLAQLNLSFNKLKEIPRVLNNTHNININLQNNDFWFSMYSDLSPTLVSPATIPELILAHKLNLLSTAKLSSAQKILQQKNFNEESRHLARIITNTIQQRQVTINNTATNKQNVHLESIQDSLTKSLQYVMEYIPTKPKPTLDEILKQIDPYLAQHIRAKCQDQIEHSKYHATYKDIFLQVYAIINDSPHKETLHGILLQEIQDGMNTCLTGQITRMVNTLNGFISEVKVTINKTEELANSIVATRKKYAIMYQNEQDYIAECVPAVWQLLEDMCIPEPEHNVWLEYV